MLAARFTAVVVLPTPPFWLAIATTLPIDLEATAEVGRNGAGFSPSPVIRRFGSEPSSGERPFARHPCAPRESLRRRRHLAEDVQVAIARALERRDLDNGLDHQTQTLRRTRPSRLFVLGAPALPGDE